MENGDEDKSNIEHVEVAPPVIEEVIVAEDALTLEKIRARSGGAGGGKEVKHKKRRRTVRHADDDDDDDGDSYDDDGDEDYSDQEQDEREEDEVDNGGDDKLALEVEEDVGDTKLTGGSGSLAAKKTVAQGMMDIALITANANQLRYILAYNRGSSTYYINLVLVSTSLILQVAVGLCLILRGRLDLKGDSDKAQAKALNNYIVMGVFLITIINVFIASFTVTTEPSNTTSS